MSTDQTIPPDATSGSTLHNQDAGVAADAPELSLEERLALSETRAAELFDQFARARAEMENVRRRAQEDVSKAHKFAIVSFAESLLPVRDSLEMALAASTPSVENMKEGVQATLKLMASVFDRNKLVEVNPVGEKFDPNRHQAISTVPVTSTNPPVPANHVVTVLQKGYLINERVLRPALVMVSQ